MSAAATDLAIAILALRLWMTLCRARTLADRSTDALITARARSMAPSVGPKGNLGGGKRALNVPLRKKNKRGTD